MNNKVHRPVIKGKVNKKYLMSLIYKSIIVLVIILVLILIKKVRTDTTARITESIKNSISYEFDIVEDSKKIYEKAQGWGYNFIDSISVFNKNTPKYKSPVKGSVYRSFNQEIIIDDTKVKNGGIDIQVDGDEEPNSAIYGTVDNVEKVGNKGFYVTIVNEDLKVVYGYLSSTYVVEGEAIDVGAKIGQIGTNKDGNKYLRIEIYKDEKAVDPMDYIDF